MTGSHVIIRLFKSLLSDPEGHGIMTKLLAIVVLTRCSSTDVVGAGEALRTARFLGEDGGFCLWLGCTLCPFWLIMTWANVVIWFLWSSLPDPEGLDVLAKFLSSVILPW